MAEADWELEYFFAAVDEVVGPFLRRRGYLPTSRPFRVDYERDQQLVSFSYDRGWELNADVGLAGEGKVGLGRFATSDLRQAARPGGMFSDESGLRRLLGRALAVLEAGEAWGEVTTVREWIAIQRREDEEDFAAFERNQSLQRARASYAAGDLQAAITQYENLGEKGLSATDRRMLYLARKQTG